MPRCPGGCLDGSFHEPRPGWSSSVLLSDQVAPPSSLSKTPAASAPTRTLPCDAATPDTLESLSSPFSGYFSPSLESCQVSPRSALRHTPAPCHSLAAEA